MEWTQVTATKRTYYSSGNPGTWRQTLSLHFDGTLQDSHDHNGTVSVSGGTYSTLGSTFKAVSSCPSSATVSLHHTATTSTLILFEDTQQRITEYTRL